VYLPGSGYLPTQVNTELGGKTGKYQVNTW